MASEWRNNQKTHTQTFDKEEELHFVTYTI